MLILSIASISMILVTSQSQSAFAGSCDFQHPDSDCDADGYTPNGGDCDDNSADIYPGKGGCPSLSIQAIQDVIVQVDSMITSGDLEINQGEINAILGKLDKAMDNLDSGQVNAAIGSLNAFINQINAIINSGSISPENGQILIDAAQNIINNL